MIKLIVIPFVFLVSILCADPSFSPIPISKIENKEKYNLGKELFFDVNLSKDKTVACVNCHVLELGGADGRKFSLGAHQTNGVINSPTIFNTKFNISQDWTGEYTTIKGRSKMAFLSEIEMSGNIDDIIEYIGETKSLNDKFIEIYGLVSDENIFDSIGYYVENLTTPNSKFDKFLKGDREILSDDEFDGYTLFKNYGCVSCHNGVNIGGNMYQKFGIFNENEINRDENLGRYKVTKKMYDKYVYKVPSLRNISKTSPYFHNGKVKKLSDTIYEMGKHQLGINIAKSDILKIELFLNTLNGEIPYE